MRNGQNNAKEIRKYLNTICGTCINCGKEQKVLNSKMTCINCDDQIIKDAMNQYRKMYRK